MKPGQMSICPGVQDRLEEKGYGWDYYLEQPYPMKGFSDPKEYDITRVLPRLHKTVSVPE
jgi:hypothetical protein